MDSTRAAALESLVVIFPKVDYRILRAAVKEATAGASVAQIVDEVVDFISEGSSSASEDGRDEGELAINDAQDNVLAADSMDASGGYRESFIFSSASSSANPVPAPGKDEVEDEGGPFFDASQDEELEVQSPVTTAVELGQFPTGSSHDEVEGRGEAQEAVVPTVPADDPLVRHSEHSLAGRDIGSGFTVDEVDVPSVSGAFSQTGKTPGVESTVSAVPSSSFVEERPSGAKQFLGIAGSDVGASERVPVVESVDNLTRELSVCAFGQTGRAMEPADATVPDAAATAIAGQTPAVIHCSDEPTITGGLSASPAAVAAGPIDMAPDASHSMSSAEALLFKPSVIASSSADEPAALHPTSSSGGEAAESEGGACADGKICVEGHGVEASKEQVEGVDAVTSNSGEAPEVDEGCSERKGGVVADECVDEPAGPESASPASEEQQQAAAATDAIAVASAATSTSNGEDVSASHSDMSNSVYERWSSSFASVDITDIEEGVASVHSIKQQLQEEITSLRSLLSNVEATESDAVTAEGEVGSAGQADLAEADRIASDLQWFRDVLERRAAELWGESSMLSDEAAALRRGLGQLSGRFDAVKARLEEARCELTARMERAEMRVREARGRRERAEAVARERKAEAQGEMEQALADERRIQERERECGELAKQLEARRVDVDALVGELASLEVQVEEMVGRGKGSEGDGEGDGVVVHAPVVMTASGVGFFNENEGGDEGVCEDESGEGMQRGYGSRAGVEAVVVKQQQNVEEEEGKGREEGFEAVHYESAANVVGDTAVDSADPNLTAPSPSKQQDEAPNSVLIPASPSPSEVISEIDSVGLRGLEDLRQLDATSASTHSDVTDMYASAATTAPAAASQDERSITVEGGVTVEDGDGHETPHYPRQEDADKEDRFDAHMRMMTELMMQGGYDTDPNPHSGNHGAPAHAFAVQHRDPPTSSFDSSAVMEVVDEDGWGVVIDAAHAMSTSVMSDHSSFSVHAGSSPRAMGE